MSDKVELIAAAQVVISAPSVSFNSNFGFKAASYAGVGSYILELDHEHDVNKLVIKATAKSAAFCNIVATTLDKRHIEIFCFASGGAAADASFFVDVLRVRD